MTDVTRDSSTGARVVVVGAGHAGGTLAALLRQTGFAGSITVFGQEEHLPYHRPPLSKDFTDGQPVKWLRDPEFYTEQKISFLLGQKVVSIDRARKTVRSSLGEDHPYDHLVLATGATPRLLTLPGGDLRGVLTLRDLSDAQRLRSAIDTDGALAIIGGGFVGLEVASVARNRGTEVIVLEREARILARVASEQLSAIMTSLHRERGTQIRTDVEIAGLRGHNGAVVAVLLADGSEIACSSVLLGVGATPREELALHADILCDQGIVVDDAARTSDPAILAIGDVTRRPVPGTEGHRRLESIPSAVEQAQQAASTILGLPQIAPEVPWFWSDQFDLKLKIAGIVTPLSETTLRGDPTTGRFALFHHRDGVLSAVESSNSPAEFMAGRKYIAHHTPIAPSRLADAETSLRDCVLV
ncbi:MAG: Ferredoxin--NAD(+) reductase [Subtercola sp.]|nr:Ferredoxin--NAD(+) reductase [Subtercola sp.]